VKIKKKKEINIIPNCNYYGLSRTDWDCLNAGGTIAVDFNVNNKLFEYIINVTETKKGVKNG